MRIVKSGQIKVVDGYLFISGFCIEGDDLGPATGQALYEYAWLEAMYSDLPVLPLPPTGPVEVY